MGKSQNREKEEEVIPIMERSASLIISFLKTHFKGGELPINWPNDCCLLYFPCHHMKQAGLDHAKIHECLGSKDASTQTEPLKTSAGQDTSDNDNTLGSLLDNKNIELSEIHIKQEPDTSFEIEKVMMKHGMIDDGINFPNWQVLGVPGDTNGIMFTQQHQLVLQETFNNVHVTGSLLGSMNTKEVEDDGTSDNVGKTDSREEKGKESPVGPVASSIMDNVNKKESSSTEERVHETAVASTMRDNVNKKELISRKEQKKLSTKASTNRDNNSKKDSIAREEIGKELTVSSAIRDVNKKDSISKEEKIKESTLPSTLRDNVCENESGEEKEKALNVSLTIRENVSKNESGEVKGKTSTIASTEWDNINKNNTISREEIGKELTVAALIRDNVNKHDSISREEKGKKSTVDSRNRNNISKKVSRVEKGKNSTVASKNKPSTNVDSGNKLARKKKDPMVTAPPRTNAETLSNAESWLRSGGKKPEQVSKASLASMWKQAKQEMEEEYERKVKTGRGRPKKRKYGRHKLISEHKSSKKRKQYRARN